MEIKLEHTNGNEYKLLACDEHTNLYLLERVDEKTIDDLTPFVVAKYLEKEDDGIYWEKGGYFCTEKNARAYFVSEMAKTLDQKNYDVLFEEMYDNVSYFNKFKMIVKDDSYTTFEDCTEEEWRELFGYFMSNDRLVGVLDQEFVTFLEDRLYEMREEDE